MPINQIPDSSYTASWSGGLGELRYFRRSDGSRLRYFTTGTGPPLVLLHTVRTQLDYFQRVIPQLWDAFTVYALDLPGMGWSDIVPGARYQEPDLRTAVVEFIRTLDLRDVTLAGESMGAAIGLLASIELKDNVSRVIAFNPYDYPGGLERGNLLAELRRSGRRRGYPTVARAIMRNLNGFADARGRYANVDVPVTLVYTEHDWSHSAEREQVARRLANVETITLPGAGHFSALERPTEMVRILLQSAGRAGDS